MNIDPNITLGKFAEIFTEICSNLGILEEPDCDEQYLEIFNSLWRSFNTPEGCLPKSLFTEIDEGAKSFLKFFFHLQKKGEAVSSK